MGFFRCFVTQDLSGRRAVAVPLPCSSGTHMSSHRPTAAPFRQGSDQPLGMGLPQATLLLSPEPQLALQRLSVSKLDLGTGVAENPSACP